MSRTWMRAAAQVLCAALVVTAIAQLSSGRPGEVPATSLSGYIIAVG